VPLPLRYYDNVFKTSHKKATMNLSDAEALLQMKNLICESVPSVTDLRRILWRLLAKSATQNRILKELCH